MHHNFFNLLLSCLLLNPALLPAQKQQTLSRHTSVALVKLTFPATLQQGKQETVFATIESKTVKEWTGYASLSITDTAGMQPADGLFTNIFADQYFSVSPQQPAHIEFPVQAPYNFSHAARFRLIVTGLNQQDSLQVLIPVTKVLKQKVHG